MPYAADLTAIRAAAARIAAHVHRTPVATCSTLDRLAGASLLLKCEQLQKAGSFKIRGALHAVLSLSDVVAERGVLTHSSGNFAQALALAARHRGVAAHLVMPVDAPAAKRAAVEGYGGIVHPCAPTLVAREERAAEVGRATGATFIHPYDQAEVIAGQGTIGLELHEDHGALDRVYVPVGGGGLVSGIALALAELSPRTRVIAAEPAGADDAWRSRRQGRLVPQEAPATIADGLRTSLGELTWPVVRDVVDSVVTVEEGEIIRAMRMLLERAKLVVEPSGAVALAAALREARGTKSAVVLSGGNLDVHPFFESHRKPAP